MKNAEKMQGKEKKEMKTSAFIVIILTHPRAESGRRLARARDNTKTGIHADETKERGKILYPHFERSSHDHSCLSLALPQLAFIAATASRRRTAAQAGLPTFTRTYTWLHLPRAEAHFRFPTQMSFWGRSRITARRECNARALSFFFTSSALTFNT